jgi:hypothetical protein
VSKPSTPRVLFPAIWIIVVVIVAVIAMTAGSAVSSLHSHRAQAAVSSPAPTSPAQQRTRIHASMDALPLAFEANQGQTDPQVKYLARANGYTLFLTADDAVFSLHSAAKPATASAKKVAPKSGSVMHLHLVGGNSQAKIAAASLLPGKSNYFIGKDQSQWHTNVAQYERVAYENVYPGINLAFYGVQRQLEFDFIVAPGANAAPIQLSASGASRLSTDNSGNLILTAKSGSVTLHKPVAYQEKNGQRDPVNARFAIAADNRTGKHHIGFELGNYDHSRELVIDPSVAFATFLGGSAEDDGYAIALDSGENAYITGQTESTNFPTAGANPYSASNAGEFDAFVTKISANGSLVYSTYVGGSNNDAGVAIAVDSNGDAFVAGGTASSNFPFVAGYQSSLNGPLNAFVFELNPTGSSLTYSTFLGGSGSDNAQGIALDSSGNAYVVGAATSTDFPVSSNAVETTLTGSSAGFASKLNATGSSLVYSTYLGGGSGDNASGVAVDASGDAYVTGETFSTTFETTSGAFQTTCGSCGNGLSDAFVSVLNPTATGFVYSTYLGGNSADVGFAIAIDFSDDAYVTGYTESNNFPTTESTFQSTLNGSQDAFVTELNPSGTALVFSSYLGGSTTSGGSGIAVDSGNDIYVTGSTASPDFPVTTSAPQTTLGGDTDAFFTEIVPSTSSLYFSTYLGGASNENTGVSGGSQSIVGAVAVDPAGANLYLTGNTASTTSFPTSNAEQSTYGGGPTDAFVAKYTQPAYGISATTPAAVSAGTSATSTVTLTTYYGYSATPVNLTCTVVGSGSPLPQCSASSFSANPVTPTSGGATTTLTITTTGSGGNSVRRLHRLRALWIPLAGLPFAAFFFVPAQRKRFIGYALLALALTALFVLPSCGGSGSSTGGTCSAIPGAPTGLAASGTTSTGTTLNWTGPTVGSNCTLGNYTIYQNGTSIGTSSSASFNVTGLAPSTTYSFTVAASDQAGLGPQSSAVSVTTNANSTPSGNYTVIITGTDANSVTRSAQVTLSVN